MKRKISIGLNIVLFFACVCSLAFGVYAATCALGISGYLQFKIHDCSVKVSAYMYGHASGPNARPISEADAVTLATNQVIDGTTGTISFGEVYFSDLGPEITTPTEITIVLTIENTSQYYPVLIEDLMAEKVYTDYQIICSNPLHVLYTDSTDKTTTITYTLRALPNAEGSYTSITSAVSVSIDMELSKLDTNIASTGYTFASDGTTITGVPEMTTSDTIIIPSTFTDKAETCTAIGNSSDSTAIANIANYKKVILLKGLTTINNYSFDNSTNLTSVALPSSLNSIGGYAFRGCTSLKGITIPANVNNMGAYSFSDCIELCSVTIFSNNLSSIGNYAFRGCTSLTSFSIPEGVTSIGNYSFQFCTELISINIPSTVGNIGVRALNNCSKLTSISIPDGVTTIGSYAFSGCTSLTSIFIPASVTSIGDSAFSSCSGLTSITVDSNNTTYKSASNALLNNSGATLIAGCKTTIIPDGVTTIGSYAFSGCTDLTNITIPEGVTTIGRNAFSSCTSLTSITIPNGVTTISIQAFHGCSGLTSITIPASVTSIGSYVLSGCGELNSIIVDSNNTAYKSVSNVLLNYAGTKLIAACKNTTIPDGVTSIGIGAFYGLSWLTSITIPASVTKIEQNAFKNCTNLISATFKTTTGWWYSNSSSATSGTTITSTDLSNKSTAATYLISTYAGYYWGRS